MTDDQEEWGPWIEHDGAHKPPNGLLVQRQYADGDVMTARMGDPPVLSFGERSRYFGPFYKDGWLWADKMPGRSIPVVRRLTSSGPARS